MVDRAAVALGAVARQPFPHREPWLALDRLADRLAVALADEPDRLAIGRAFFAIAARDPGARAGFPPVPGMPDCAPAPGIVGM